jgi:hypothetical protein
MTEEKPLTAADLRPVIQRLDAVVGLLTRVQPRTERANLTERIGLLAGLGLDNAVIARIVGRSGNYVAVVRKRLRATTNRRKGVTRAQGKGARARPRPR